MRYTASDCSSPFVLLGPDVFELVLAHVCGESLTNPISTDAYRKLLPFAICCTQHYHLTHAAIKGLALLPLYFTQRAAVRAASAVPPFPIALYSFYSPAYRHYGNQSSCHALGFRQDSLNGSPLDVHLPRAVCSFPNLRSLHVCRTTRLSTAGFEALILSVPHLRELVVSANRHLTIDAIRQLPTCKQLRTLRLSDCTGVGDDYLEEGARIIASLAQLRTLGVAYWNITDEFVEQIAHLPHLTSLDLSMCMRVTSRACFHLAQFAKKLVTFKFRCSPQLTDNGVLALAACPNLECVNLSVSRRITDAALQNMADAQKMPALRTVLLSQCELLTDTALTYLSSNHNILHLDLSYCASLTDHISYTLRKMHNLQEIDLSGCPGVSDDVVEALKHCKLLRNISLRYCLRLTDASVSALCSAIRTEPYNLVDVRECVQISTTALNSLFAKCITLKSGRHDDVRFSQCP